MQNADSCPPLVWIVYYFGVIESLLYFVPEQVDFAWISFGRIDVSLQYVVESNDAAFSDEGRVELKVLLDSVVRVVCVDKEKINLSRFQDILEPIHRRRQLGICAN